MKKFSLFFPNFELYVFRYRIISPSELQLFDNTVFYPQQLTIVTFIRLRYLLILLPFSHFYHKGALLKPNITSNLPINLQVYNKLTLNILLLLMLLKKLLRSEERYVTFVCHRFSISEQLTITIKIFIVFSSRLRSVPLQYNH